MQDIKKRLAGITLTVMMLTLLLVQASLASTTFSYLPKPRKVITIYGKGPLVNVFVAMFKSQGYEVRVVYNDFEQDTGKINTRIVTSTRSLTRQLDADTTPPSVEITRPENNSYVSGTVIITVVASDNVNVSKVLLYIDDTLVQTWNGAGTFDYTWDTTQYSEGQHNITAWVNDTSGNINKTTHFVTVDNTAPSVTITSPQQGEYIAASDVTVMWTGSDNYEIDHYEVSLDNGPWINVYKNVSYTFTGVSDGDHNVTVAAFDKAGNVNVDIVIFTVDTTPPSVTITSPANGEYLNTKNVTVNWYANDEISGIDHYEIRCYNTTWDSGWINVGLNTSYTFTNLNESDYTIEVRAYDKAGNIGSTSIVIHIDLTAPTVTITSPQDGDYVNTNSPTIQWTASDNSGIDHYEVLCKNSTWNSGWINVGTSTSYTFSDLTEGEYTVFVKAYDYAGNIGVDSITIFIDVTPPSISITSPSNDTHFASTSVTVSWTASDNIALDHYDIYLDGNLYDTIATSGTSDTQSYDFTNLAEGQHNVTVIAFDKAGNSARSYVIFYVDITPPSIKITSPSNDTYFASTSVTVSWTASDNIALDHYDIYLDDVLHDTITTTGTSDSQSYEFTGLTEGQHNVTVVAFDKAGNNARSYVIFYVDITSPSVKITSPNNDTYFASTSVTVSWTASDNMALDHYDIYLNSSLYDTIITSGTSDTRDYTFNNLAEGQHNVTVVAYDKAGNKARSYVIFYVDITSPSVKITSPSNDTYFASTSVTVSWTASDNIALDHYDVYLDNNLYVTIATSGTSDSQSYDFTNLAEGQHNVTVVAFDKAGNNARSYVIFYVDVTPPSIKITSPSNDTYFASTSVTVSWTASDNVALDHYDIYLDDNLYDTIATSGTSDTQSYDFTGLAEGQHNVTIIAFDKVNQKARSYVIFYVDLTSPSVKITSPSNDTYFASTSVTVSWTASDNMALGYYDLYLDSNLYDTVVTSGTSDSQSYDFTNLAEGQHNVTIVAYDKAGNKARSYVIFYVDITPPSIKITSPSNDTYFASTSVTVSWTASDNIALDYYDIYLDNTSYDTVTTSGTSDTRSYDFTNLAEGKHNVTIVAFDKAGNNARSYVIFYVDITPPSIKITQPLNDSVVDKTDVNVTWTASDNLGLDKFEVYLNGTLKATLSGDSSWYLLENLRNADYNVTVVAYDRAGNWRKSYSIFTVSVALAVMIISPDNDTWTNAASIQIDITYANQSTKVVNITLYINSTREAYWELGKNLSSTLSYTFTPSADGHYNLTALLYDEVENTATDTIWIHVDRTAPSVSISAPANMTWFGTLNVYVSWSCNDNMALKSYAIFVNGTEAVNNTIGGTTYSRTDVFSVNSEGVWNLTVIVNDKATNLAKAQLNIGVDITPPSITPSKLIWLANASTTSVTVSWSGSDSVSDIDHYEIFVSNSWINVGQQTSYSIDVSSFSESLHVVYIRAYDKASNYAQSFVIIIVDRTLPSIKVYTPENNSIVSSENITICWNASDNILAVKYYEISTDGTNWIKIGRRTSYTLTKLTDKSYTFYIRAYDVVGNYIQVRVVFTVDLTPPSISITSPSDTETVTTSNVTVQWSGSDANGIAYYLVRLDNNEWIRVPASSTNYTFLNVGDGLHVIYVMAVDVAGHRSLDSIVIKVSATSASSTSTSPTLTTRTFDLVETNILSDETRIQMVNTSSRNIKRNTITDSKRIRYISSNETRQEDKRPQTSVVIIQPLFKIMKTVSIVPIIIIRNREDRAHSFVFEKVNSREAVIMLILSTAIYLFYPP